MTLTMSTNSCTSPTPSVRIFPISRVISAPSASRYSNVNRPVPWCWGSSTDLGCKRFPNLPQNLTALRCRDIAEDLVSLPRAFKSSLQFGGSGLLYTRVR